jgi:hypothetical protein
MSNPPALSSLYTAKLMMTARRIPLLYGFLILYDMRSKRYICSNLPVKKRSCLGSYTHFRPRMSCLC